LDYRIEKQRPMENSFFSFGQKSPAVLKFGNHDAFKKALDKVPADAFDRPANGGVIADLDPML
jgi:hypothetical protein